MKMQSELSITAKPSPTPEVCSFEMNVSFSSSEHFDCREESMAQGSPLLENLFHIKGVSEVFVDLNKITIRKSTDTPWNEIGPKIGMVIRENVHDGEMLFTKISKTGSESEEKTSAEEFYLVQGVLDEMINPYIANHGGVISLINVENHKAYILLEGGCHGCSMSLVTLKESVEVAIMDNVPSIAEIIDTTDHTQGKDPFFKS